MKPLPLVLSVPHAGTAVPAEVNGINRLSRAEIEHDGDEGAAEIYLPLEADVAALVTTPIARAFVDQNRAANDFSKDGVVKTHTCWDVPIYHRPLTREQIRQLLDKYYSPYHLLLAAGARRMSLGIDCHTMAAIAPPVGPDFGQQRPRICLGNDHSRSCTNEWLELLAHSLALAFETEVALNQPFAGGYITRGRPGNIPWMQLELSREPWLPPNVKREHLRRALSLFCRSLSGS